MLLDEIRRQLNTQVAQQCHTHLQNHHQNSFPELQVTKLDDVTSCLMLLRDYVISWSHEITKNTSVMEEKMKRSRERATDLELQLQETISESESSEGNLLAKLQVSVSPNISVTHTLCIPGVVAILLLDCSFHLFAY